MLSKETQERFDWVETQVRHAFESLREPESDEALEQAIFDDCCKGHVSAIIASPEYGVFEVSTFAHVDTMVRLWVEWSPSGDLGKTKERLLDQLDGEVECTPFGRDFVLTAKFNSGCFPRTFCQRKARTWLGHLIGLFLETIRASDAANGEWEMWGKRFDRVEVPTVARSFEKVTWLIKR